MRHIVFTLLIFSFRIYFNAASNNINSQSLIISEYPPGIGLTQICKSLQTIESYFVGHGKNCCTTPPTLSGLENGVICEVKEFGELTGMCCGVITKQSVRNQMWEGLCNLSWDNLKNGVKGAASSKFEIYKKGGDPAWHEGGKDAVAALSMIFGGFLKKGGSAIDDAVTNIGKLGRYWDEALKKLDNLGLGNLKNKLDGLSDKLKNKIGEDLATFTDDELKFLNDNIGELDEWKRIAGNDKEVSSWIEKVKQKNKEKVNQAGSFLDNALIAEMKSAGIKFTETDLKFISKNKDNFILFLEKRNSNAGLQHIIERHWNSDELMKFFNSQDEMIKTLFNTIKKDNYISKVVDNKNRLSFVYKMQTNKGLREFTLATGDNGFIVSFIPK